VCLRSACAGRPEREINGLPRQWYRLLFQQQQPAAFLAVLVDRSACLPQRRVCLREVTISGFEQPSLRQIDQASRTAQVMLIQDLVSTPREGRHVSQLGAENILVNIERAACDANGNGPDFEEQPR
jgi:hypothetical protein